MQDLTVKRPRFRFDPIRFKRDLIVLCGIALNVALSAVVQTFELPIYLDTIGTIIIAWICGPLASIAAAIISNLICMLFSRMILYFTIVNIIIVISVSSMFHKRIFQKKLGALIFWITTSLVGGVLGGLIGWSINSVISVNFVSVPFVDNLVNSMKLDKFTAFMLMNIVVNLVDKGIMTIAVLIAIRFIPLKLIESIRNIGYTIDTEHFDLHIQHRKLIIMLSVEAFALVAVCAWISVALYTSNARRERIETAIGAAQQVADAVDPRLVDIYLTRGHEAQSYDEVKSVLQSIRDNTQYLDYVYIYKIAEDGCHVVFDTVPEGEEEFQPGELIDFDASFLPYIQTLLDGGELEPLESDDTYGWLLTLYKPILDLDGNCVAYAGVDVSMQNLRDYVEDFLLRVILIASGFLVLSLAAGMRVSEIYHKVIQHQYEVIKESKDEAELANQAKSSFLANMSHEIRTPINAVLGMNEMILRESEDPSVLEYSENVKTASNTLLGIVNDILDFSKIEAGKMEILPVEYDLSSVINDLVNMIRTRADDKGLILELEFDETTPKLLHGDEVRIKQVITNILTNAVKYTEKGSVTFRIGYERIPEEADGVYLIISVSDTGIGIKQEDISKLFSEFERIEEKRNRNIEGTGLGMNITKSLLEMMDSRLDVESVYGKGSTFSFRLKQKVIRWEELGDYESAYRASIASHKRYKEKFSAPDAVVLVVDDTPMNLAVFKSLLKRTSVQIDTAGSGDECLALVAAKKYDIIFLDHMMPKKDGIETLNEMRASEDGLNRQTPTVCLTANAISGAREQYIAAGFDDYLTKPIDADKLEKTLIKFLPKEKLEAPSEGSYTAPVKPLGVPTVLIVDDDPAICSLAAGILSKSFRVESCNSAAETPQRVKTLMPDLVLLDINLGEMTGFDVLRLLREEPETSQVPIMFITGESDEDAEIKGFRVGAADFVRKPFLPEALLQRAQRIITLDHLQRDLRGEVRHQAIRAEHITREMMLALSKAVDAKDRYTSGHSERVAAYSAEIARRMGKSESEQTRIYEMGLLHDIGKIGVPGEIINKTTKLLDEEFEQIKRHTITGSEILGLINEMPELASGARSHHERYDGHGYPDGLKGTDIPESARIICLADSYDAMTSMRTYSKAKEQSAVRAEIERCAGTQFDPEIAKILLDMIDEDKNFIMKERTADINVWKENRLWNYLDEPQASEESEVERAEASLPDWLRGVAEIDLDAGMRYCGSEETYIETLAIYAKNAPDSADEIETLWRSGDAANTTVKVHAIKSLSRTIGAEKIGALAEKLELAGKAGETETLASELDGLLARIRALCSALSPLCPSQETAENENLPLISDEELSEAYENLREFAENMDAGSAAYVFSYLAGFRIPQGECERVENIKRAINGFDWDKVNELLK